MANRFQNKKLNKDDHKNINEVAGGIKKSGGLLSVVAVAVVGVKKYGKPVLNLAKTIILKK
ncbi:MAG: 50S ribosomal protein L17 [Clostridia bacterium]|nr:50S ribosomal protein L17 [Clostridia bacterium]